MTVVRKRTLILTLVIVIGFLLGISLLVSKVLLKEKEPIITLTVVEDEPSLLPLPLYVALQQGYFEGQGIRVRLAQGTRAGSNDEGIPNADVVFTDPVAFLFHKAVRPAAPVIVTTVAGHDGTFLLAKEKEDFSWNNLKEKRVISFPPETGPGLALDKKLRDNGLTPFRDTGIYHRIPQDLRLGAFKSGTADYIQLAGIQALTAEQDGTGFIATPVGDREDAFPAVLCAVSRETINKQPQAVQIFVNGLYKAQLYMAREPELGLKAAHKFLSKNERQQTDSLLEQYVAMGMWQPLPGLDEKTFGALVQAMEVSGQLPAPVKFSSTVNNDYARQAAETVQYIPPEERDKNWLQKLFS